MKALRRENSVLAGAIREDFLGVVAYTLGLKEYHIELAMC